MLACIQTCTTVSVMLQCATILVLCQLLSHSSVGPMGVYPHASRRSHATRATRCSAAVMLKSVADFEMVLTR